ncbi:MAG: FAD-dependent oxidoreductase [Vicingaceae bacterium]
MSKPIILSIDDDAQVLRAISQDLKSQYRKDFRVLSTESANEALELLTGLKKKSETIALLLVDQRMPEMLGVEFLEKAKSLFPKSKRVLLTAYSDTDAAIKAINDVQLDYYLMKPWNPPEEKLYPVLDDLLEDWKNNVIPEYKGLKIIGLQYSPKSHVLKDFLSGNLVPYRWFDYESSDAVGDMMKEFSIDEASLPVVITEEGEKLIDPDIRSLSIAIGMKPEAKENVYDVVIVGAGPAGLAAAVYGASEGLSTLLIEKRAPGGQAGTSSRIENYLGFPSGLSGQDLARRAITQATRFGTEFLSPQEVVKIEVKDGYKIIKLVDGSEIMSKCVVISSGVNYRKLEAKGVENFTGAGVYYGAAMTEAAACKNKDVFIVGGGNSAGQAAMYLANFASAVNIVIRKDSLKSSMSEYLIKQLEKTENIKILSHSEVIEARGNSHLEKIILRNNEKKSEEELNAGALFLFIGAKPYTDWLELGIIKNEKGFIETGRDLHRYEEFKKVWKEVREPALLETCSPGIYAAGDVRAGAMNRVASAVGEGAMTIKMVHEYLSSN